MQLFCHHTALFGHLRSAAPEASSGQVMCVPHALSGDKITHLKSKPYYLPVTKLLFLLKSPSFMVSRFLG